MKGYVIYAQGERYIKQAEACAKSIRKTGDKLPICLITDYECKSKEFDHLVKVETDSDYHVTNRSKIYELSPFSKTTVLDSDTLVLDNLEFWWKRNDKQWLKFVTHAYTYRHTAVDLNYYRKTFLTNNLPNLYIGMHYFERDKRTEFFFKWVQLINEDMKYYSLVCKNNTPRIPSMDVAISIAAKILDCADEVTYDYTEPKFVHMKPNNQGWNTVGEKWSDKVNFYQTDKEVYIGNYKQTGVLHYVEDIL